MPCASGAVMAPRCLGRRPDCGEAVKAAAMLEAAMRADQDFR
jgi:hypothetical protein